MRSASWIFGFLGMVFLFGVIVMDTSVTTEDGMRVQNIGLLNERLGFTIVGSVFLLIAFVCEGFRLILANTPQALEEKERKRQARFVRAQTQAQPTIPKSRRKTKTFGFAARETGAKLVLLVVRAAKEIDAALRQWIGEENQLLYRFVAALLYCAPLVVLILVAIRWIVNR